MESARMDRLKNIRGPVLITGHTGFKGTWMTFLLEFLEIPVIGYSLPPEQHSLYSRANRIGSIPEEFSDIQNKDKISKFISKHKPSTIIHMAAQPLVLKSYEKPAETFCVNVLGTVNVLDLALQHSFIERVVIVTSDKVYRNSNSGNPFIESDPLEGKDPYSASKVATEAAVKAWQQLSGIKKGPKILSVRAGNVVGGGDWSRDRLIPDIVRSVESSLPLLVRNPNSIRPWQHVLDPLFGYLLTVSTNHDGITSESYNFGPEGDQMTVEEIVTMASQYFGGKLKVKYSFQDFKDSSNLESQILTLNSNKAKKELGFTPKWDQKYSVERTFEWWNKYLGGSNRADFLVRQEVEEYLTRQ